MGGDYSFKCACVEHTTILIYEFMGVDDSFYIKLLENASNKCSDCRKDKVGKFYWFISLFFVILNLRECVSLHMEQLGSDSNSQTCLRGSLELF